MEQGMGQGEGQGEGVQHQLEATLEQLVLVSEEMHRLEGPSREAEDMSKIAEEAVNALAETATGTWW
jgi:hypothetical protein